MKIPPKRWLLFSMIFTLIAVCVHAYLANQHYALESGLGTPSLCNVNERFNCDAVAASKYSVFLGIPVAVWGLSSNLILLLLTFVSWAGWTEDEDGTGRYAFGLGILQLMASVVMGGISVTMHTYCLFCLTAYALSILQFASLWKGTGRGSQASKDFAQLFTVNKWILVMFLLIPGGAFLGDAMIRSNSGLDKIKTYASEKVSQWKSASEKSFDMNRGLVFNEKVSPPKMTIVEFADFLCPHCKHAVSTMNAFVQAHQDVRFVFKAFPLDSGCNPILKGPPGDGVRCTLAKIPVCAQKLNQTGWAANEYLFENQEKFLREGRSEMIIESYCADQKADCVALKACLDLPETTDTVKATAAEAGDISGTPTIFVNGRKLDGGVLLPVLNEAYRSLQ